MNVLKSVEEEAVVHFVLDDVVGLTTGPIFVWERVLGTGFAFPARSRVVIVRRTEHALGSILVGFVACWALLARRLVPFANGPFFALKALRSSTERTSPESCRFDQHLGLGLIGRVVRLWVRKHGNIKRMRTGSKGVFEIHVAMSVL